MAGSKPKRKKLQSHEVGAATGECVSPVLTETPSPAHTREPWTHHRFWAVAALAACLLPLWPLFNLHASFQVDWTNHTWMIGYFGEYFRRHFSFPVTFNTDRMIGVPFPVFYGFLFYPLAGVLSAVLSANITIRLVCAAVLLVQSRQVYKTAEGSGATPFVAFFVSTILAFATYPLTNLYNRSAVTEFMAAGLLNTSLAMWIRFIGNPEQGVRDRLPWKIGLVVTLLAGTHPLTAVFGGFFLAIGAAATFLVSKQPATVLRSLALPAMLMVMCVAPWAYVMQQYGNSLNISSGRRPLHLDAGRFDVPRVRFWPIPRDLKSESGAVSAQDTPYLDAQVNMPLFFAAAYLGFEAIHRRKALRVEPIAMGLFALAAFGCIGVTSVSDTLCAQLPHIAAMLQFPYRSITYCDFFLLIAALAFAAALGPMIAHMRVAPWVLGAVFSLSVVGACIKVSHAEAIVSPGPLAGTGWGDRNALIALPGTFYGLNDYAMLNGIPELPPRPARRADLQVLTSAEFGQVSARQCAWPQAGLFQSNVQGFPWNHLYRNGAEINPAQFTREQGESNVIFNSPAGAFTLEYKLQPDPVWITLRLISLIVLFSWIAYLGAIALVTFRVAKRQPAR